MKFTIVFPSYEAEDLSIAAVFIPCLVWKEGNRELLNPHPENPNYLKGDLGNLFEKSGLEKRISDHTKKVTVIAHAIGHGNFEYLENLRDDIVDAGFDVTIVHQ